ncbi:hypothetical protein [Dermabacter vaginalis]|uniref:hypothetical protein n=1 Tax=Dermabacter vaginalis TaxID=1630135 RepID=UPI001EF58773|nr:hypothetical protein [Dermabacter vaginalis]MCG7442804.1 hypothetical protein [Dermabacter vaginalis]
MFLLPYRGFRDGDRVGRNVRDIFVLVDHDLLAYRAQQNVACSKFAAAVQNPQIGDKIREPVEPVPGLAVRGRQHLQTALERLEIRGEASLFLLQQVERDRIGIVSLDELQPFGFELLHLCR